MYKSHNIFTGLDAEIAALRQGDAGADTIFEDVQTDINTLRGIGQAPVGSVFEGLDVEIATLRNTK